MDTKLITITQMMERYGISRKRAYIVAEKVGMAPRRKNQTILVSRAKADAFLGVKNG